MWVVTLHAPAGGERLMGHGFRYGPGQALMAAETQLSPGGGLSQQHPVPGPMRIVTAAAVP